jgi:hypothetical protein
MTDVIFALCSELRNLEAELANDPRYQKIGKIRELLAMYGAATQSSNLAEATQPMAEHVLASGQATKADRIRSEIESLLRANGIVHRKEILDRLTSLGIMGSERDPMASLAAYLSEMRESIVSHGGGKWGFRNGPIPTKTTTRRKIRGAKPDSLTTAINQAAAAYLRKKGLRAKAPEIREALISAEIDFGNAHKGTMAACLSHSPLFDNVRGQGYGLVEWLSPKPAESETPNSSELFGAPKANGALPLNF